MSTRRGRSANGNASTATAKVDVQPTIPIKPSHRGVAHTYAAFVAPIAGILLTLEAPKSSKARLGLLLYTLSLTIQFTASAVYHRPNWQPSKRRIMKAIDHAAIYVLIAGIKTITPLILLFY